VELSAIFGDYLGWLSCDLPEAGPQDFVTPFDLVERLFHRGDVQVTDETQSFEDVVGLTVWIQLMQKPESLLSERERQVGFPRCRLKRQDGRSPHSAARALNLSEEQ
jgi:hypothetical protein